MKKGSKGNNFSVAVFVFVTTLLFIIVISGILVSIYFEEELAKLILLILIAITIIIGIGSLLLIEIQKNRYSKQLEKQISRNTSWAYSRSTTIEA